MKRITPILLASGALALCLTACRADKETSKGSPRGDGDSGSQLGTDPTTRGDDDAADAGGVEAVGGIDGADGEGGEGDEGLSQDEDPILRDPRASGIAEYLIVEFDGKEREVIIDDRPIGYDTGDLIRLRKGSYEITLRGEADYQPDSVSIEVADSHPGDPIVVKFKKP